MSLTRSNLSPRRESVINVTDRWHSANYWTIMHSFSFLFLKSQQHIIALNSSSSNRPTSHYFMTLKHEFLRFMKSIICLNSIKSNSNHTSHRSLLWDWGQGLSNWKNSIVMKQIGKDILIKSQSARNHAKSSTCYFFKLSLYLAIAHFHNTKFSCKIFFQNTQSYLTYAAPSIFSVILAGKDKIISFWRYFKW